MTKSGVTTSFAYDGFGRRVLKAGTSAGAAKVVFVYDQEGQLLGEYDANGKALREYVWLGSLPVAMFTPDAVTSNPPRVYFIHADHLGAPRVVFDQNNAVRWRWLAEPFGTTAPETDPSGLGAFTLNLRFPGQYADSETGLFYNYFRDYDASVERYIQSDPIGLVGGVNTYSYVGGVPTMYTDPSGLLLPLFAIPGVCATGACEALIAAGIMLMSPPGQKAIRDTANAVANQCKDDDDPCDIVLDKGQLKAAGIRGREHEVKGDELGTNRNLCKFDLCGCKDGRVVVKAHGCKGPVISVTDYRWK